MELLVKQRQDFLIRKERRKASDVHEVLHKYEGETGSRTTDIEACLAKTNTILDDTCLPIEKERIEEKWNERKKRWLTVEPAKPEIVSKTRFSDREHREPRARVAIDRTPFRPASDERFAANRCNSDDVGRTETQSSSVSQKERCIHMYFLVSPKRRGATPETGRLKPAILFNGVEMNCIVLSSCRVLKLRYKDCFINVKDWRWNQTNFCDLNNGCIETNSVDFSGKFVVCFAGFNLASTLVYSSYLIEMRELRYVSIVILKLIFTKGINVIEF